MAILRKYKPYETDEYEKSIDEKYKYKILKDLDREVESKGLVEKVVTTTEIEKIREIEVQKTREKAVHEMIKTITTDIEPLREVGSKVVGDVFDRVNFLRERIVEIRNLIEDRKLVNSRIIQEIDADVADREKILSTIADIQKRREFKLDISLLRMERRRESANFWRDLANLRKELVELEQEYQFESKIAKLFADLR